MGEWQPIASAPHDVPIMLWSEHYGFLPGVTWSEGRKCWMFVVAFGAAERCYAVTDGTHWMPLPPPPALS
jgi:hypothetical protein